jgi:hypothetical protein
MGPRCPGSASSAGISLVAGVVRARADQLRHESRRPVPTRGDVASYASERRAWSRLRCSTSGPPGSRGGHPASPPRPAILRRQESRTAETDYGVNVPHHVRTGEPFDPKTMLSSDRDFTDEELTRRGTTREDYWRQQHKSDREDALALNAMNAYLFEAGKIEKLPPPVPVPPERLPTPPFVRPR